MALPRKPELIQRVVNAIKLSGWSVLVLQDGHPAKLSIFRQGSDSLAVMVYIWNITHGGATRDVNELRIQITGVHHFREEPGVKTTVLGWSDDMQVFGGWDVTQHRHLGSSPSFQIRRETMQKAKEMGICPQTKENEVAVAIRSDFIVAYFQEIESLHGSGSRRDFATLRKIVQTSADPKVIDIPTSPRRTVLQQVQRKVRDARFRANIMSVYEHRCAVSGIQLDLLDAAHIIPVEHKDGTDEITNGLCLTAIHHRAFDNGLIAVRSDYSVAVNDRKLGQLKAIGWDGGADLFKTTLRDHIILPRKTEYYPSVDYLVKGQRLRGWYERELRV